MKFRLTMDDDLTPEEVRRIDQSRGLHRFEPELLLDVDAETLSSDTGIAADHIVISLIVRDRELGQFEKICQWKLRDLPDDLWRLNDVHRYSFSRLDVVVVATPDRSICKDDVDPSFLGTLLASKAFKIRGPIQAIDFPIKFVEPEEMATAGYDRGTVCCVRWIGEDISRPPVELIEVWLNSEFEDKYRALNARGSATDHISCVIAAHVYGDVLAHVLVSEEDSDEPESLVSVVADMIRRELDMTLEEARQTYLSGPEGRSRLVPWCWKMTGADRAFAGLTT